mgnify:CR=1 FL=1
MRGEGLAWRHQEDVVGVMEPLADRTLRWALALIDPPRAERLIAPAEKPDPGALVALLERQKVPLLSLHGPLALRLQVAGPAWGEAVAREQGSYDAQRAEFARVLGALARGGVPGLLIKAVGCPPSFPYRSDNLDLLVPAPASAQVGRLLLELGYVEVRNVEEPAKFLFRRFAGGQSVGTVHLHERVGWGTGFMDEAGLWRRARPAPDDPELLIPGPGDALLITLAHAFYEDKRFSLGDLQRLLCCLRGEGLDWAEVAAVARGRGWYVGYLAAAALVAGAEKAHYGDTLWPDDVLAAARELPAWARRGLNPQGEPPWRVPFARSKRHYFHKLAADRALSGRAKLADGVRHAAAGLKRKLGVRSQRPFLVALHGVDGSGKTAQAEALVAAFGTCELRARRSWRRLASSPLSGRIIGWARRLAGGAPRASGGPEERLAARRRQLRSPLLRAGFTWLSALDLWLGYLRQVAWPLWRGQVIVADRYVLDAAAELGQLLGHPAPERLVAVRLLRALSPRPHLACLLEVPPELAASRSSVAESAGLLAEQARTRRRLAALWGVRVVDGSRPFIEVSAEIERDALRCYYAGFRTVLNAVFLTNPRRRG